MYSPEKVATELVSKEIRLGDYLHELRAAVVQQALIKYGNPTRAAKAIGIDRKTFCAVRAGRSR